MKSNTKTRLPEYICGKARHPRSSASELSPGEISAEPDGARAMLLATTGGRKRVSPLWLLLLGLGFMIRPVAVLATQGPALLYVDPDAPGIAGGRGWAGAYNHLQDALTAATSVGGPVEIRIANGIYRPDTSARQPQGTRDRHATFRLGNVTLIGGYAGFGAAEPNANDIDRYPTVLTGDLNGDDTDSTPTLNLLTAPNRADNSLHVICGSPAGPATIRGLTVTGGNANSPSDAPDGGAIFSDAHSHPINMQRCTLTRNSALGKGGAVCQYGYGDSSYTCGETLACKFTANYANEGGAIANIDGSSYCENCIFLSNGAARFGAAMHLWNTQQTVYSCTCAWNYCLFTSGGLYKSPGDKTPLPYAGTLRYGGNTSLTLTNSILWDNTDVELTSAPPSRITVAYSIVRVNLSRLEAGYAESPAEFRTADGQVRYSTVDPLLTPDGHLRYDSPCIEQGDPNFHLDGHYPEDVGGEGRVINGRIDIGADEFLDTDQDHLPDWWEHKHHGDPNSDPDNDGLTNYEECCLYGSDPSRSPLYVDSSNTDDPLQDGTDSHPFATLQAGLDHAANGDTILVAPGRYLWGYYKGKAIVLRALEGEEHTIINQGSHASLGFCSGESPGAAALGFTATNFFCEFSSPQVRECTILHDNSLAVKNAHSIRYAAPVLADCTIVGNRSPGVTFTFSRVRIEGTVELVGDGLYSVDSVLSGQGTLKANPDPGQTQDAEITLEFAISTVQCSIDGPATIKIVGEVTVESSATIDLHGHSIICPYLLRLKDDARLLNARVHVKRLAAAGNAIMTNCVVSAEAGDPLGQFFVQDNARLDLPLIKADGDRYLDLNPQMYDCNSLRIDKIQVTITEGIGDTRGGLFELRGMDQDAFRFGPHEFFCHLSSVPDFSSASWTIDRLELLDDAKLNLTNRFDFQSPYDSGGDHEVLYVRDLVLGAGSILNTAFNRLYYENLTMDPAAKVVNVPMLGFSLNNITFDDENDYLARVTANNNHGPDSSRAYVQRVQDMPPDPQGMMSMCNGPLVQAKAKGLFAKSNEEEVAVAFEYLFDTTDPTVELAIYLSDVPELLGHDDPLRRQHYLEVGRISPPPMGRPGSKDSGRFGVYWSTVSRGQLDFIRGTRIELELVGPEGTCVFINNWDPQIHCSQTYCADVTGDLAVTVMDFLTVVAGFGGRAGLLEDGTSTTCLDGIFSNDGTIDADDILSWDWQLNASDRLNLCHVPLGRATPPTTISSAAVPRNPGGLKALAAPSPLLPGDILIAGKGDAEGGGSKLQDRIIALDAQGRNLASLAAVAPRGSTQLIFDQDGVLHQLNSESGLMRLVDGKAVIPPGSSRVAREPRHGLPATVSIGLLRTNAGWSGRPVLDAAFDAQGDVYVTPAIVHADGVQPYAVAARLRPCPQRVPPYEVITIYDDPPLAGDNQERNFLRSLEIDGEGNLYVIHAHHLNESDILWVYDRSTGGLLNRADLVSPDRPIPIPAPTALCASRRDKSLYVASSRAAPDATSATVYRLSSKTLGVETVITIDGMGHITDITEDSTTGDLWVVGLIMTTIPEYIDDLASPFYRPRLARVPASADAPTRLVPSEEIGDLSLPASIVWTAATSCGDVHTKESGE